jgi:hypothetical protein
MPPPPAPNIGPQPVGPPLPPPASAVAPPRSPSTPRKVVIGLGIGAGALAVLVVIALLAVNLVGTTANRPVDRASSSATDLSSGGPGAEGSSARATSGPCGGIPELAPYAGPSDPGQLISPATFESLPTEALSEAFPDLAPGSAHYSNSIEDVVASLPDDQAAVRRQALRDAGFIGGAWISHRSLEGDQMTIGVVALRDTGAALDYGQIHLAQACQDSSKMSPSEMVPGAVVFFNTDPDNGRPQARLVVVAGNTEINLTLCTCHPDTGTLATAESWAADILELNQLPSA